MSFWINLWFYSARWIHMCHIHIFSLLSVTNYHYHPLLLLNKSNLFQHPFCPDVTTGWLGVKHQAATTIIQPPPPPPECLSSKMCVVCFPFFGWLFDHLKNRLYTVEKRYYHTTLCVFLACEKNWNIFHSERRTSLARTFTDCSPWYWVG